MKFPKEEIWRQAYLANERVYQLLGIVDGDLAEIVRQGGCVYCAVGVLHSARYPRKPRGGPPKSQAKLIYRASFCCDQDGCRKRHTPPSVRFLGRRFYWGLIVVLVAALHHGLTPERVRALREALGIDRRTLERWRAWWLGTFVQTAFWKAARARFLPALVESALPWSLCEAFALDRRDRLLNLLRFLSPLTTALTLPDQPA